MSGTEADYAPSCKSPARITCRYEGQGEKWQASDDVAFVDAIPVSASGKMLKNKPGEQFREYRLPTA
jgi:3-(methylthio)propionyl---CoA ligase